MTNIKTSITLLICSCISFYCFAQTASDDTQSSRIFQVTDFNEIEISGSIFIEYSAGEPSAKVIGNKDALKFVEIAQDGKKLKIWSQPSDSIGELTVYTSSPQISKVLLEGNGSINLKTDLYYPDFNCILNGSGSINISAVNCKNSFCANINGSGGINIKSINSPKSELAIFGSGGINTNSITSRQTNISLKGAGGINIQSCNADSVSCELLGSGGVNVNNITTTDINTSLIGTGDIILVGTTNTAIYSLINLGTIKAGDLKAKDVKVSVQGEGKVECFATGQLEGKVSGAGEIIYNGDPI